MAEAESTMNEIILKCDKCGKEYVAEQFLKSIFRHGLILLKSTDHGFLGIICTSENCNRRTIMGQASNAVIQAVTGPIFEIGESGPGYFRPLIRYDSFPYGTRTRKPGRRRFRFAYPIPLEDDRRFVEEKEVEDLKIPAGLYVSYSFGHLAIGPVLAVWWYNTEDIENNILFENTTGLKAFPRYCAFDHGIEAVETFCYKHRLHGLYADQMRKEHGEDQGIEEVPTKETKDAMRTTEFLQVLTTPVGRTDKSKAELASDSTDMTVGHEATREIEPQVITDFNKGYGREFFHENYLKFIRDYTRVSTRADFTPQKAEQLRKEYLGELHQQIRAEALTTKQYAFFEEGKTWTIIFNGKRIANLTGKGFRYIHYLVSHMRKEYSASQLAALGGTHETRPFKSDPKADDKSKGKATRNPDREDKRLTNQSRAIASEEIMKLREQKDSIEGALREATEANDIGRQNMLNAKLDTIYEELEKYTKTQVVLQDPKNKYALDSDKVGHNLKRALLQLMEVNKNAGDHFMRALRKNLKYKGPRKYAKHESNISYDPVEDINWKV